MKAEDREEVEKLVSDKISNARLQIAENRINFLLRIGFASLVLFGILVPLWLTRASTERVDNAIQLMEKRFEEIVGKQLRRPSIECFHQNKNLEGQSVDCIVGEFKGISPITIRNNGDGPTHLIDCRLYLGSDELPSKDFGIGRWHLLPDCDESPEYDLAFDYLENGKFVLHPEKSFSFEQGTWSGFKKGTHVKALLKVYYGEPEAKKFQFTINFK